MEDDAGWVPRRLVGAEPIALECRYDPDMLANVLPKGTPPRLLTVSFPDGSEVQCPLLDVKPSEPYLVPQGRWQRFKARWFPKCLLRWFPVREEWWVDYTLVVGNVDDLTATPGG